MSGKTYGYIGLACVVISIFFAGIIFAPLAIYSGYKASKEGEQTLGKISFIAGIILLVIWLIAFFVQQFYM